MSVADIILIVIFLIGAIGGYREGFLMELFSLLALLLGVLGGFKLMGWAMVLLGERFDIDQKMLPYIAFAFVFVVIVIVVRLTGNLIKLSLDKSFLGRLDQAAGAVLGLIKTAFVLSVLLWLTDSMHISIPHHWTDDSLILPRVATFAPAVTEWIARIFPVFDDVF